MTTWNLQWFPNGSPRTASPEAQEGRIQGAAGVIRELDPDILLLQEVQDWATCERLAAAVGPGRYQVAVCSAFPEANGIPGAQQVAILARASTQAAWAERWKALGSIDPPRGFAFAWLKIGGADIGVYCVHLKSNLVRGNSEREVQSNILKRELSAEQLITHSQTLPKSGLPILQAVLIGGDFNTNPDQEMFVSERTLQTFAEEGFANCWSDTPLDMRITHPGSNRYPDATFDYVFSKGGRLDRKTVTPGPLSDHYPVTVTITLP